MKMLVVLTAAITAFAGSVAMARPAARVEVKPGVSPVQSVRPSATVTKLADYIRSPKAVGVFGAGDMTKTLDNLNKVVASQSDARVSNVISKITDKMKEINSDSNTADDAEMNALFSAQLEAIGYMYDLPSVKSVRTLDGQVQFQAVDAGRFGTYIDASYGLKDLLASEISKEDKKNASLALYSLATGNEVFTLDSETRQVAKELFTHFSSYRQAGHDTATATIYALDKMGLLKNATRIASACAGK